jgi:hypothetical protein
MVNYATTDEAHGLGQEGKAENAIALQDHRESNRSLNVFFVALKGQP